MPSVLLALPSDRRQLPDVVSRRHRARQPGEMDGTSGGEDGVVPGAVGGGVAGGVDGSGVGSSDGVGRVEVGEKLLEGVAVVGGAVAVVGDGRVVGYVPTLGRLLVGVARLSFGGGSRTTSPDSDGVGVTVSCGSGGRFWSVPVREPLT